MEADTPGAYKDGPKVQAFVTFESEEDLESQLDGHPERYRAESSYEAVCCGIPWKCDRYESWMEGPLIVGEWDECTIRHGRLSRANDREKDYSDCKQ
jgi:hypothetical protein